MPWLPQQFINISYTWCVLVCIMTIGVNWKCWRALVVKWAMLWWQFVQWSLSDIISLIYLNVSYSFLQDVTPYMNPCPYTVSPNTRVSQVFNLFRTMGLRHLPVVNAVGEVRLRLNGHLHNSVFNSKLKTLYAFWWCFGGLKAETFHFCCTHSLCKVLKHEFVKTVFSQSILYKVPTSGLARIIQRF